MVRHTLTHSVSKERQKPWQVCGLNMKDSLAYLATEFCNFRNPEITHGMSKLNTHTQWIWLSADGAITPCLIFTFWVCLCVHTAEFPPCPSPELIWKKEKSAVLLCFMLNLKSECCPVQLHGISGFVMHTFLTSLIICTARKLWFQPQRFNNIWILPVPSVHACMTANMKTVACTGKPLAFWTLRNSVMMASVKLITGCTLQTVTVHSKGANKNQRSHGIAACESKWGSFG